MKGSVVEPQPQTPAKNPASSSKTIFTKSSLDKEPQQTPSKKRTPVSSNLDESIWRLLNFSNTPGEGIRRMLMWPIITTTGVDGRRMYLSYLQGDLHATKVSLPTIAGQTLVGIRQLCWEQLQCDMKLTIGTGSSGLISLGWEKAQWTEKWQYLEDGSFVCHVLAIMTVAEDDDIFYFDECKYKWTEACLLKVLINPNWDIPKDSIFPLRLLTEYWGIDTSFLEKDSELSEAMEVAAGASFKLSNTGDFDSPDKPLVKKRGTTGPQELRQTGYTSGLPSSSEEDLVVTSVVLPAIPTTNRFTPLEEKAVPGSTHLAITVVVRLAFGLSMESALTVMKEASPTWPVLLVKKSEWTNLKAVKIALHKELATWLPLTDSSTRYPLIKLYHWNLVFSSSEPGMHLVILTLNPLFTKHMRRWLPAYRFYAPQLLQDCEKLDPKWSVIEQLPMRSQYEPQIAHHE
jgi:hypothetical protein